VATNVGGTAEIVMHGKTGLLVRPGDPVALAEGLLAMAASPAARSEMGARARATITTHFTFAEQCARYCAVFDRLTRHRPQAAQ
jgi:glycosyltransferase involved in cell wall biosynthesis